MDELKKYLQDNKRKMDVDEPSAALLQRLQNTAGIKPKSKMYGMLVRAAAAAGIIGVILLAGKLFWPGEKKIQPALSSNTEPAGINTAPIIYRDDTVIQSLQPQRRREIAQQKNNKPGKQLPEAFQLLSSFEQHYNKLVSLQLKSIRTTPVYGETPGYFNDFKNRIHRIDEDEWVLKKHIKTSGLSDELLEQLINVYQQKIDLLKELQHEISGMNNKIKENRQPADSVKIYYINI